MPTQLTSGLWSLTSGSLSFVHNNAYYGPVPNVVSAYGFDPDSLTTRVVYRKADGSRSFSQISMGIVSFGVATPAEYLNAASIGTGIPDEGTPVGPGIFVIPAELESSIQANAEDINNLYAAVDGLTEARLNKDQLRALAAATPIVVEVRDTLVTSVSGISSDYVTVISPENSERMIVTISALRRKYCAQTFLRHFGAASEESDCKKYRYGVNSDQYGFVVEYRDGASSDGTFILNGGCILPPPSLLIPLYNYPNHWESTYIWDDVAAANATTQITVIINPDNGPGVGGPNADYVVGMDTLRNAGVSMLGYVHTSYGARSINDVKADIDQWASLFEGPTYRFMHGIFLDEVSSNPVDLPYYLELEAYIWEQAWATPGLAQLAYLNFGTSPDIAYYNALNSVMIVSESDETTWDAWTTPPGMVGADTDRFGALVHGANPASLEAIISNAIARNIGHIYVTDRTLASNPWNGLPSFWSALVGTLAQ